MRGSSLVAPIMLFVLASAMAGIIQMAGRQAEYQPELPAQTSSGPDFSPQTSPHQTPPSSGPYDPANTRFTRADLGSAIGNKTCEQIRVEQREFIDERQKQGRPIDIAIATEMAAKEAFACDPTLQTWSAE